MFGIKWMFILKKNRINEGTLDTLDYSQVSEVEFTENFTPFIKSLIPHMLIASGVIHVETAFCMMILMSKST
jgi:hypothetical protein